MGAAGLAGKRTAVAGRGRDRRSSFGGLADEHKGMVDLVACCQWHWLSGRVMPHHASDCSAVK